MRKNTPKNRGARLSAASIRTAPVTPQAKIILKHLSDTGTITQREALMDHSVQSLTRRITELRDAGFKIDGTWKSHPITGQRYMRYSFNG